MQQDFDPEVRRALEKWPDVPACYGWLGLDRRGNWLIKGDPITHRGAVAFLGRNYARDPAGRYFVQNGPQRAYCDLAYTPFIYILDGLDRFLTHTGLEPREITAIIVDDQGDLLLETELGIGLVHDRDMNRLITLLEAAVDPRSDSTDIGTRMCALDPATGERLMTEWRGAPLPVRAMPRTRVAAHYQFDPAPREPGDGSDGG